MASMSEDATVTSKGQITIPKRIRDRLGLESGTEVTFVLHGDEVTLRPKSGDSLDQLRSLRDRIQFDAAEIERLQAESREAWSTFQ
jgi:AbrB family looped-hinge helix DNA binding protein